MAAGDSAEALSVQRAREARSAQRASQRAAAGAKGERAVAAVLDELTAHGWILLADRHWPGTDAANIDMLLVGPGGIFVIDAKNWARPPKVVDGDLFAGSADITKLLQVTALVENALASLGVSRVAICPLMVFAGRCLDAEARGVRVLGTEDLAARLAEYYSRLTDADVHAVANHLDAAFPPHRGPRPAEVSVTDASEDELAAAWQARNRAARDGCIERWMTFLHIDQRDLVSRRWNGPARISGSAGTGKSVVALHRAASLAMSAPGPILVTTFVRSLPQVHKGLVEQLRPEVAHRIEFVNLHAWAANFLRSRGRKVRPDNEDSFWRAWRLAGQGTILERLGPTVFYWMDEIDKVIKGRGITDLETYLKLERRGRRLPLNDGPREAVWELYTHYERIRTERGRHDFADLLIDALTEVRREPPDPGYACVIVDEVQDLSLVGVQLAHALVGDRPDGLLLVGDSQQKVYPGGYHLSDAGIDVRGRSRVLKVNHRNGSAIVDRAIAFIGAHAFDDIDGTVTTNAEPIVDDRTGEVHDRSYATVSELDAALLEVIRRLPGTAEHRGAAAVLCAGQSDVEHYTKLLTAARIPVQPLTSYRANTTTAVKVGTFLRSKGLDFKYVYLPQYDTSLRPIAGRELSDVDRLWLARNQIFVGMTRARDVLWLATVCP